MNLWNTNQVIKSLRLLLLRERSTEQIQSFINHPKIADEFQKVLLEGSQQHDFNQAKISVQHWIYQQKNKRTEPFSVERLWHFLHQILEKEKFQTAHPSSDKARNTSQNKKQSSSSKNKKPKNHQNLKSSQQTKSLPQKTRRPKTPLPLVCSQPSQKQYIFKDNAPLVQHPTGMYPSVRKQLQQNRRSTINSEKSIYSNSLRPLTAGFPKVQATGSFPSIQSSQDTTTGSFSMRKAGSLQDGSLKTENRIIPPTARQTQAQVAQQSQDHNKQLSNPAPPLIGPPTETVPRVKHLTQEAKAQKPQTETQETRTHWNAGEVFRKLQKILQKDPILRDLQHHFERPDSIQKTIQMLEKKAKVYDLQQAKSQLFESFQEFCQQIYPPLPFHQLWDFLEHSLPSIGSNQFYTIESLIEIPHKEEQPKPEKKSSAPKIKGLKLEEDKQKNEKPTHSPKELSSKVQSSINGLKEQSFESVLEESNRILTATDEAENSLGQESSKPKALFDPDGEQAEESSYQKIAMNLQLSSSSASLAEDEEYCADEKTIIEVGGFFPKEISGRYNSVELELPQEGDLEGNPVDSASEISAEKSAPISFDQIIETSELISNQVSPKPLGNTLNKTPESFSSNSDFEAKRNIPKSEEKFRFASFQHIQSVTRAPKKQRIIQLLLAVTVLALSTVGFISFKLYTSKNPNLGSEQDAFVFQRTIPISKAFQQKQVLSFILQKHWKRHSSMAELKLQTLKFRKKRGLKGIRFVHFYSPNKKLLHSVDFQKLKEHLPNKNSNSEPPPSH